MSATCYTEGAGSVWEAVRLIKCREEMTPEERFERIETQLELLARYGAATADRLDSLADRLEGLAEAQRHTQTSVDQISRDVAKLVDAVASLVKLFERHVGDGHGGKQ